MPSRREQIILELGFQLERTEQELAERAELIAWLKSAISELTVPGSVNGDRADVTAVTEDDDPEDLSSGEQVGNLGRVVTAALRGSDVPLTVREISERIDGPHESSVRNAVYELLEDGAVEQAGPNGPRGAMTYLLG